MQKILKRSALLLTAVLALICLAVLSACQPESDNGDDKGTTVTSVNVTVKDEKGNPINGLEFGEHEYSHEAQQVVLQFCYHDIESCLSYQPKIGEDGKTTIDLEEIRKEIKQNSQVTDVENTKLDVHVIGVVAKGYTEIYGTYSLSEFPAELTITLKKA